jgi:hypothetical protein
MNSRRFIETPRGRPGGPDGHLHFRDADKKPQFAVVSVKGGGIKSGDIRDLKGTMERERAALGLFLTLNAPTREMERESSIGWNVRDGWHEDATSSNPHRRANPGRSATTAIWTC